MSVAHLNKETFEEMIAQGISMIDFWAEWCMPCQALLPVIEELGQQLEGSVKVGKVNCDENRELVKEFRVMSIPTVIFFKDGEEVDRIVGGMPKAKYLERLETLK
ncbi:MAG: thioredoxin [Oscillospiraceae bacterium]|nr:thioredoxin [Oscillospiraceae bacterium]